MQFLFLRCPSFALAAMTFQQQSRILEHALIFLVDVNEQQQIKNGELCVKRTFSLSCSCDVFFFFGCDFLLLARTQKRNSLGHDYYVKDCSTLRRCL